MLGIYNTFLRCLLLSLVCSVFVGGREGGRTSCDCVGLRPNMDCVAGRRRPITDVERYYSYSVPCEVRTVHKTSSPTLASSSGGEWNIGCLGPTKWKHQVNTSFKLKRVLHKQVIENGEKYSRGVPHTLLKLWLESTNECKPAKLLSHQPHRRFVRNGNFWVN